MLITRERLALAVEEIALEEEQRLHEQKRLADTPVLKRYCPHPPSEKQAEFLALDCEEAFYGGAAGGGKSDALLMAALQYFDVPGYAALIVRRSYSDLSKPDALMPKARAWLGPTDARWVERDKSWYSPQGASITFGYLETANDKYQYQGSAFQFIGFDEVTQFLEADYRYVGFSRRRRLLGMNVPLRTRAASNPDGVGFEWVKQRFVNPGTDGVPFIEAKLDDNPGIDAEQYVRALDQLDPVTRARLLLGDWEQRAGGNKFRREWFEVVDALPIEGIRSVRYWDLASTEPTKGRDPDYTVGCKMARNGTGLNYIADMRRDRLNPAGVEALIKQTAELDGRGTAIYIEQEPGASGKHLIDHYVRTVLAGFTVRGIPSTGDKELRANPLSSQAYAGNVKIVRGSWNAAFLDEASGFPDVAHDDQIDAAAGAFQQLTSGQARLTVL